MPNVYLWLFVLYLSKRLWSFLFGDVLIISWQISSKFTVHFTFFTNKNHLSFSPAIQVIDKGIVPYGKRLDLQSGSRKNTKLTPPQEMVPWTWRKCTNRVMSNVPLESNISLLWEVKVINYVFVRGKLDFFYCRMTFRKVTSIGKVTLMRNRVLISNKLIILNKLLIN